MHFLRPEASWLLFVALVPILLYLLPLPRLRRLFPSVMLWRRVAESEGLRARRDLRRVLASIVVSVLILGLIICALGRLVIGGRGEGPETGPVVVVLDTSASMQVREGAGSRFDRARFHASAFVEGLAAGTTVALVTTAPAPEVVVRPTTEASLVGDALQRLGPSDAPGDLAQTLAWLENALGPLDPSVHVFTDGAFETPQTTLRVRWHLFGESAANTGVVSFGVRRVEVPEPRLLIQARVGQFADASRRAALVLRVNGTALPPRPIDLAANCIASVTWDAAPADAAEIALTIDPGDRFGLDDQASAVLEPVKRRRVILVAEKPPVHLLAALRADASVQTFLTKPENYRPDLASDLTVFVNTLPAALGPECILLVHPASSTALVKLTGETVAAGPVTCDLGHPLLAGLAWRPGLVKSVSAAETPAWARAALDAPAGPLILAGTYEGRRAVVLTFDPENEPLARTATFPILVRNIVDYLASPEDRTAPSRGTAAAPNLCDEGESDLRPRLKVDAAAGGVRGGVPSALVWTLVIVAAVVLLAVEAVLYHRRILE